VCKGLCLYAQCCRCQKRLSGPVHGNTEAAVDGVADGEDGQVLVDVAIVEWIKM